MQRSREGGIADFLSEIVSSLRRQSPPRGDRRDSQPRHQLPSAPASTFANFSPTLVLTISETYDHIPQYGVRQMSEDHQANGTSNTGRKAEK
jgi:hypothetical protein